MRIGVLGASGGTGVAVTSLALAEGHEVTALVRNPARFTLAHERLTVVPGDALVAADVDAVVAGEEAVFVSLGLSAAGSDAEEVTVCTTGITHVLAAMARHDVHRLVVMSTHGVNDSDDGSEYVRAVWSAMGERLKDKVTMEPLVRASDTRWTIVRAPRISPAAPRGPFRVDEKLPIDFDSSISHDNLARFVIDELTTPAHVGRALSISE
jgi:putative NADH-flavin reductase